MSKWPVALGITVLCLSAGTVYGQQHEFGVLAGGVIPGNHSVALPSANSIDTGTGLGLNFFFDERIINAHVAALYVELPVIVIPNTNVSSSNVALPRSYSSVFVTPSLKLNIAPFAWASPYAVLGGGLAHFNSSGTTQNDAVNTHSTGATSAAYDIGGGMDLKFLPFLGGRFELRDVSTGNPKFNVPVTGGRQHNLLLAVGLVVKF